MRKLLVIALAAASTTSIFADNSSLQEKLRAEQKKNKIERISSELKLTDSQREEMKAIQQKYVENLQSVKDSGASKEEIRTQKRELNKQREESIKSILTPEQLQVADKMKFAHLNKGKRVKYEGRKQMSPEQRADRMTDRMTKALGLSDQQQQEVAAINLKYANQQAEMEKGKDMRAKMMEMRNNQKEELAAVLTQEQLNKIEELEAKRAQLRNNKRARSSR
jgi:Spy/CpxP family protein refolding chaperone